MKNVPNVKTRMQERYWKYVHKVWHMSATLRNFEKPIQWNVDLTKCLGNGPVDSFISRVRYIENLVTTNLLKNNQSFRYIGV